MATAPYRSTLLSYLHERSFHRFWEDALEDLSEDLCAILAHARPNLDSPSRMVPNYKIFLICAYLSLQPSLYHMDLLFQIKTKLLERM